MVIQCTKKMLDQLKIKELCAEEVKDTDELKYWHCNLLKYSRENAVLITHDKTLFSFFLIGLKSEDFKCFDEIISQFIFKTLLNLEFPQKQIELVLNDLKEVFYAKSSDKSVLASMNQMKKVIDFDILDGKDILTINRSINTRIYGKIDYDKPLNRFYDFLDSQV